MPIPASFTPEELDTFTVKVPESFTPDELERSGKAVDAAKEILTNLTDRRRVLKVLRENEDIREDVLRAAPGVGGQLRKQRGGAVARVGHALGRGVSQMVAQPIMELTGTGGTEEEIESIRQFEGVAAQTFNPATPDDPWYERGPLMAIEMVPWMTTIVRGGGLGKAGAAKSGLASAMARMAGKGRVTMRAGQVAGITAAAFPGQYASELDSLKEAGVEDVWWKKPAAALIASAVGVIEGIVPDPFKAGKVSLTEGALKAGRSYLLGALKKAPGEASEEYLQGLTSGVGRAIATHLDENAPDQGLGQAFSEAWNQGNEALLPLAFMLGTPAVVGAGVQAARAQDLREIREGNVSRKQARELGLSPEESKSVQTRNAAVDQLIQQKEAEDASQVSSVEEEDGQTEGGQGVRQPGAVEDVTEQTGQGAEAQEVPVEQAPPAPAVPETPQAAAQEPQPWQMTKDEFERQAVYSGTGSAEELFGKEATHFTPDAQMAAHYASGEKVTGKLRYALHADMPEGTWVEVETGEEVTPEEFWSRNFAGDVKGVRWRGTIPPERAADPHRHLVEEALRQKKPVPPEVLADYPDLQPETPQAAAQELESSLEKAGISVKQSTSKTGQVGWVVAGLSKEAADGLSTDYQGRRLPNGSYYFKHDPAEGLGVAAKEAAEEAEQVAAAEASGLVRTRIGTLTPEQAEYYEAERKSRLALKQEELSEQNAAVDELLGNFVKSTGRGVFKKKLIAASERGDPTMIPRFDEMVQYSRDHPELGLPQDEAGLFNRLTSESFRSSDEGMLDAIDDELAAEIEEWIESEGGFATEEDEGDTSFEFGANVEEPAITAPFGAASKPSQRPDIEPQPGTPVGPVAAQLQPVQTPELFQMAKELMGGKIPRVKKLPKSAGLFKGPEGGGPISILIDPKTAKTEDALAQTLAHEFGHLVDYLPEATLKRGNVLGRLQSLRDFLKTTMPPLDAKSMRIFRREAKRNLPEDATKEQVQAEYERLLDAAGLTRNTTIRDELLGVTKWWSGDYEGATPSYVKYRESSRELYAEALSVLLNSPGDLEARAPTFYREFMERLDAKPQVLEAYSTLQQMLNGSSQELAEARTQTLRDMFDRAEDHINALRKADEQQNTSAWSGVMDYLGQYFLTSGQPVFKRTGRKPFKSQVENASSEAEAARYALDELFTIDAPNHTFLRAIDENVYQPMVTMMQEQTADRTEAEAQANFMIGQYLFHHRITDERFGIANPAGFVPSASQQQLEAMESVLGKERYAMLEGMVQDFHDLVFAAAEEAVNEGVYNKKTFDEEIAPNKDNYAAFRVTHYIDDADVIATGVMKQVGTFSDIQNPFHSTLLKVVRLNRLTELNRGKNRVRTFLESEFAEDITPVETDFKNRPKKKPGKGKDHLMELVNGKPTYFEVPAEIAKSFSMHDIGGLKKLVALNNIAYKIFHPLFVTYNPGFVMANPFRDLRRTWVNLGATNDISLGRLLHEWAKAIPVARRRANGVEDAVIREMIDSHALDVPYVDISAEGIDTEIDTLFKKHGLRPEGKPRLQQIPVIGRLLEMIEHAGAITETATKVASWRALEQAGVPLQERAYTVRKYAGTPDYKQRGLATPITNSMMMYSRVRWNGLAADIGLATNPATAGGYWWRQLVNVIMPTTMAKLGAYGSLGFAIRAMFGVADDDDESVPGKVATWTDDVGKRVAKYFLTDYDVFPIGVNGEGKAVFATIPRDDLGKFIARVWWHATDAAGLAFGQDLREGETIRDVGGNLLTDVTDEMLPSLSPPLDIFSKWAQYSAGINPVDSFYNQQIVPRKQWTAGGWHSDSKMIAWTLDKFGTPGSVIHYALSPLLGESFETGPSGGTEAVMKTVGAMTGLKRFIRVSDSGLANDLWARLENADQEAAAFRLSLPEEAQDATTRRYFLMRREAMGDKLSLDERREQQRLNLFYNDAYVPLRKMILQAEESGMDSQKYRDAMKQAADRATK